MVCNVRFLAAISLSGKTNGRPSVLQVSCFYLPAPSWLQTASHLQPRSLSTQSLYIHPLHPPPPEPSPDQLIKPNPYWIHCVPFRLSSPFPSTTSTTQHQQHIINCFSISSHVSEKKYLAMSTVYFISAHSWEEVDSRGVAGLRARHGRVFWLGICGG